MKWNSVSEGDVFEGAAGLVVRVAGLVGVRMRQCPELGFCERLKISVCYFVSTTLLD